MRALICALAGVATLSGLPMAEANVVYTQVDETLTTPDNPGGGCCDGTGIWFNPLTGYAEQRGYTFPDPLYSDGMFFLLLDSSYYINPEAEIYVQGYFSRGNGVIYQSSDNLNPARFAVGASIGPTTGYQSAGAGYPDLGPNYGNWSPGRGFLGLTIRDPSASSSDDIFYGFADITVNADYSITLNAFAYEDQRGVPITTSFSAPVPEPGTAVELALGLAALAAWSRRRLARRRD